MGSRCGEEVVAGVREASGLARIDPGRPCGAERRSAEGGDGGGSHRFSGKMERREWGGCAARERAERGVKACTRSVGLRDEEWAEEARPAGESPAANGASSTRGRRGVDSIYWGGDSREVITRGAEKRRQRRLGEEDPVRI